MKWLTEALFAFLFFLTTTVLALNYLHQKQHYIMHLKDTCELIRLHSIDMEDNLKECISQLERAISVTDTVEKVILGAGLGASVTLICITLILEQLVRDCRQQGRKREIDEGDEVRNNKKGNDLSRFVIYMDGVEIKTMLPSTDSNITMSKPKQAKDAVSV